MNTIEQELKDLILLRYKSIREFASVISMPYSTIDSIFKRGVLNASITNIIKICDTLSLSADALAKGMIKSTDEANPLKNKKNSSDSFDKSEEQLINIYRQLNEEGQKKLLDNADDLLATGKYKKTDEDEYTKEGVA